MDERRKINKQHKYKDKRRNANSAGSHPSGQKTTQPKNTSAAAAGAKKARANRSAAADAIASATSSSDSDDPYSSKQFSKRTIVKNWDKYERDGQTTAVPGQPTTANPDDYEQMSAADFGQLLSAPAAEGAHFRFSSEKGWDLEANAGSDLFGTQFFRVNVTQMERQLMSVPFYERQGYATELFTADEVQRMRAEARAHTSAVPQSVAAKQPPRSDATADGSTAGVKTSPALATPAISPGSTQAASPAEQHQSPVVTFADPDDEAELDALLNMVSMEQSKGNKQAVVAATLPVLVDEPMPDRNVGGGPQAPAMASSDLNQWLDDILDE